MRFRAFSKVAGQAPRFLMHTFLVIATPRTTGDMIAIFGDVTRAFPHAPVDVPIVTRLPTECDGLVLHQGEEEELVLRGGQWILIGKALYGYRRSPRLWQQWLTERLEEVSLQRSAIDPALFYNLDLGIGMLVHVDDMLLIGPEQAVRTLFKKVQGTMNFGRPDVSGRLVMRKSSSTSSSRELNMDSFCAATLGSLTNWSNAQEWRTANLQRRQL